MSSLRGLRATEATPPVRSNSKSSSSASAAPVSDGAGFSPAIAFTIELAKWGLTMGLTYYLTQKLIAMLNEASAAGGKGDIISAKRVLAKRLKRPEIETMDFNIYEARISADVCHPDEIDTGFDDIGGMEEELQEVKDNIVLPMQMWKIFKGSSDIAPCPTGALLYGRPGTGKTLTAKAIAKESGATFISIKASTVMDKWFGESDKLVTALFSLGRKLAPCIVFIDEIDTLLKKRGDDGSSNGALQSMQGAFLAEWDGLSSSSAAPVVVLGATNRPMDLDKAFLRRMPVSIKTRTPDLNGRVDILRKLLASEKVDGSVMVEELALGCEDFTGSDLRELVRVATLQRAKFVVSSVKEAVAAAHKAIDEKIGAAFSKELPLDGSKAGNASGKAAAGTSTSAGAAAGAAAGTGVGEMTKAAAFAHMRPLNSEDFDYALSKCKCTGSAANDYASELLIEEKQESRKIIEKVIETLMNSGKNA